MPKRPLLDKISLFFFGKFESKKEFSAMRRLSATSVSLSNPKTALNQSEAVQIILDFLTLSNSHFRMHYSEGGVVKDWSNIAIFRSYSDV